MGRLPGVNMTLLMKFCGVFVYSAALYSPLTATNPHRGTPLRVLADSGAPPNSISSGVQGSCAGAALPPAFLNLVPRLRIANRTFEHLKSRNNASNPEADYKLMEPCYDLPSHSNAATAALSAKSVYGPRGAPNNGVVHQSKRSSLLQV